MIRLVALLLAIIAAPAAPALAQSDLPDRPILTGHEFGVITINVTEANDAERERRRLQLHEPYRTILGHFRHEIGHCYWNRFFLDEATLWPFAMCSAMKAGIMPNR